MSTPIVKHLCAARRNLLDGSAASSVNEGNPKQQDEMSNAERWPVAWLLLKSLSSKSIKPTDPDVQSLERENIQGNETPLETKSPQETANPPTQGAQDLVLAIPLRIDLGSTDYTVSPEVYTQKMKLPWRVGQRFQMFFAGNKSHAKGRSGEVCCKLQILRDPLDSKINCIQ